MTWLSFAFFRLGLTLLSASVVIVLSILAWPVISERVWLQAMIGIGAGSILLSYLTHTAGQRRYKHKGRGE